MKTGTDNIPQARRVVEYGLAIMVCPTCGEPAYEDDFCLFCGKRYTMPPPHPDDLPTITGGHEVKDGVIACDECGGTRWRIIRHEDGADYCANEHECMACKAHMTMTFKRLRDSWED